MNQFQPAAGQSQTSAPATHDTGTVSKSRESVEPRKPCPNARGTPGVRLRADSEVVHLKCTPPHRTPFPLPRTRPEALRARGLARPGSTPSSIGGSEGALLFSRQAADGAGQQIFTRHPLENAPNCPQNEGRRPNARGDDSLRRLLGPPGRRRGGRTSRPRMTRARRPQHQQVGAAAQPRSSD
jgi:hypothetical protein